MTLGNGEVWWVSPPSDPVLAWGGLAVVAQSKELCGFVGKVVDGKVPDSWGAS